MSALPITPADFGEVQTANWPVPTSRPSLMPRRVKPSYQTMIDTLNQWADDCKDDDEMMHMSITLDDVAAQMANAHEWANEAREQAAVEGPDNSWTARQDACEGEMG